MQSRSVVKFTLLIVEAGDEEETYRVELVNSVDCFE